MRLRKIKNQEEKIKAIPYLIEEENLSDFEWFRDEKKLFIEIGMGKGGFLCELAKRNPNNNYLGIDCSDGIILKAHNANEMPENVRTLIARFEEVSAHFPDESIAGIYLNFSDPWPKARHMKRRLTSEGYLQIYDRILVSGGYVQFKTDAREFFDFSLDEFIRTNREPEFISFDLHHDDRIKENIMTEYEDKFSKAGNPIHCLIYRKKNRAKEG